ncbi:hypothetical protein BH11PSE11_BH11PSE11_32450 [soil metagenome]
MIYLSACCPVSPPDGTARPGQMSVCFFDLLPAWAHDCNGAEGRCAVKVAVAEAVMFWIENAMVLLIMLAPWFFGQGFWALVSPE